MGSKNLRNKKFSSQTGRSARGRAERIKSSVDKTSFFGFLGRNRKKDAKETPAIPVTGWKLWLFRVLAITVIPAFLFMFIEAGLRLAGYGYPTSLTIRCKVNNIDSYCNNLKYSWRFFDPAIARTTDSFVFPVKKSDQTYRIFVMGESAAAGTPDGAYSFGRMLRIMLRRQYPETNFEVITAAMPAINSHVILEIAKDCARCKPDLYILYMGNNEVVGPYGAGTVFTPMSANLSLIRFGVALKSTRVGQLLTNLTGSIGRDSPKVWYGMEMFLGKQVRKDDPQMEIVYNNFRHNIEDICHVAEKNKIPLICCTVGSNLKDSPPFASEHSLALTNTEKEKWDDLYQQGIKFETDANYASASDIYLKVAQIDPDYADLQFRLGRCYWETDKFEESKDKFVQARELDTLRFRADNQINIIIQDVAGNKASDGIYFVDACKVFEKNSPHQIPGQELFYEHVHLNFKGNYLLAQTLFRQMQEILPERIRNNSPAGSIVEGEQKSRFPSEQEVARYLAYTDWERHKIEEKVINEFLMQPPFTNQLYHSEHIKQKEQQIKVFKAALTRDVMNEFEQQYLWAIQQSPTDAWLYYKYGLMLEDLDKFSGAARQYEIVLNYGPTNYDACGKLALCYGRMGDLDAAIEYNLKTIKIYPYSALVYFNLGFAYHLKNMYDKAIESYEKAVHIDPTQAGAYNNLALLLYDQGKVREAVRTYRTGLKFIPDDLNLHYNFSILLKAQNQKDEAIKELREALKIDPNYAMAINELNSLLD
ncbi:MAG: tetratricopeptide repeat protein [Sedimentisphaerales bacterium]|nr:tetratricopeptide repeat protein [Sedimentisphaerales bacterium]